MKQERYEREPAELHWNCPFFRHCWNEGLKLPTRHDYPECSNQYREYRQSQTNRRSIHTQDVYHHNNMDRCLKNKSVHDRLGKRVIDQDWADHEEEGNERKYAWQEGQWCPRGLTRRQKRRVQRLRNKEMKQAQASGKTQVWCTKQIADRKQPSANIQMAFLLPSIEGESQQPIQAVDFGSLF